MILEGRVGAATGSRLGIAQSRTASLSCKPKTSLSAQSGASGSPRDRKFSASSYFLILRIKFILDIYNNIVLIISEAPFGRRNTRARMLVSTDEFIGTIVRDLVGNIKHQ